MSLALRAATQQFGTGVIRWASINIFYRGGESREFDLASSGKIPDYLFEIRAFNKE